MRPPLNSFSLGALAATLGSAVEGGDRIIRGAAGIETAGEEELCFVRKGAPAEDLRKSKAGAFIIPPDVEAPDRPHIRHDNPRYAFAVALALLEPGYVPTPGIHPTAIVAADATIGESCSIGPYVVIEPGATVGDRTVIGPFTVIERGAEVGADCRLDAHVVIYRYSVVGNRCTLFAGATVGCDGFGFEGYKGAVHRIPHVGITVIEDDVEIGARSCVDRGTTGETRVGAGTKIDNLVMIGHNCVIGRSTLIAGQTGMAGSTRIGNGVQIGGSVSIADHAVIGDGARLAGRSGVWSTVPPGVAWSGYPARDHRAEMREVLSIPKLPQLLHDFRRLQKEVTELRAALERRDQ